MSLWDKIKEQSESWTLNNLKDELTIDNIADKLTQENLADLYDQFKENTTGAIITPGTNAYDALWSGWGEPPADNGSDGGTDISDNSTVTENEQTGESTSSTVEETEQTTTVTDTVDTNVYVDNRQEEQGRTVNAPDSALDAIDELISQALLGGTPTMQAQANATRGLINDLQARKNSINYDSAQVAAQQQLLQQKLTDEVLPQISGAQEAAGQGQTALGAILTQNAAIQTAMAQSLVELEARKAVQEQLNMVDQALLTAIAAPDQNMNTLLEVLNSAKGTIIDAYNLAITDTNTRTIEETSSETVQTGQAETVQEGTAESEETTVVTPPEDTDTGGYSGGSSSGVSLQEYLDAVELMNSLFPFGPPNPNSLSYSGTDGYQKYLADKATYDELLAIISDGPGI